MWEMRERERKENNNNNHAEEEEEEKVRHSKKRRKRDGEIISLRISCRTIALVSLLFAEYVTCVRIRVRGPFQVSGPVGEKGGRGGGGGGGRESGEGIWAASWNSRLETPLQPYNLQNPEPAWGASQKGRCASPKP